MQGMPAKTIIKLAFKLFLFSIAASLIAAVLSAIDVMFKVTYLNAYVTCVAAFICWAMMYSACWKEAKGDWNREKFGHIGRMRAKGFAAGLMASVPLAAVYLYYLISGGEQSFMPYNIYLFMNMPYFSYVIYFRENPVMLAFLLIPLPVAAGIGYLLGYRRLSISERLVYKNVK